MQTQSALADLVENNKRLIQKIYNTVKHRIHYYVNHTVINDARAIDSDTVSIVMTTHDSVAQTLFSLRQIARSAHINIQVVLVDDSIEAFDEKHLRALPYRIDYVKINNKTRDWVNACVNYNIGFTFVKGAYVIIQNPMVVHIGDVIRYTRLNCSEGKYLVFNVIASHSYASNDAIYAKGEASPLTPDSLAPLFASRDEFKWYQHADKRPHNFHFLTAIHTNDLAKLNAGFDYDLAMGHWYNDTEFIYRIQHVLGLEIVNAWGDMGCHLYCNTKQSDAEHSHSSTYKKAIALNAHISKHKISHFEQTKVWPADYLAQVLGTSIAPDPTFVFMVHENVQCYAKYYHNVTMSIHNVLKTCGYKTICQSRDIYKDLPKMLAGYTPNQIYVLNPFDFSYFCMLPYYGLDYSSITSVLQKINYIVIWQEVLTSDYRVVGYPPLKGFDEYIRQFFGNSKLNLISNKTSLDSLISFNIHHNFYTTVSGYSEINGLVPFDNMPIEKTIDVLVYGSIHTEYIYRSQIIEQLQDINKSNGNKYTMVFAEQIHDDDLDWHLRRARIVVHIPSFPALVHMPWAKIAYLQVRGVFFIIEENDELYTKSDYAHIPFYKHSDSQGLYEKIGYYLQHPEEVKTIVEKNSNYIKVHSNLDVLIPNLIKTI